MRQRILLLYTLILIIGAQAMAQQVDQVSTGAGYANQAYYDIETGKVTEISNDTWDIAFSTAGQRDAGVFINESRPTTGSGLSLFMTEFTDFSTHITDTAPYVDSVAIYNAENNWTEGAFNSVKDPSNYADYGWGTYNPNSHIIEGNKVFLIKKRDESFIKCMVNSLSGDIYTFTYADLDGANKKTLTINKAETGDAKLVYITLETGNTVDIPTNYDLCFLRYNTPLSYQGGVVNYVVTGVLTAPGVETVVAEAEDISTVKEEDYKDKYTDTIDNIGWSWKTYGSGGYTIDENHIQFVKTQEGKIYKIQFLDFEGSSTGTTTLEKTYLRTETTSTSQAPSNSLLQVFPNPVVGQLQISGISQQTELSMYDASGRLVKKLYVDSPSTTVEVGDFPKGMYLLKMKENQTVTMRKFIKL